MPFGRHVGVIPLGRKWASLLHFASYWSFPDKSGVFSHPIGVFSHPMCVFFRPMPGNGHLFLRWASFSWKMKLAEISAKRVCRYMLWGSISDMRTLEKHAVCRPSFPASDFEAQRHHASPKMTVCFALAKLYGINLFKSCLNLGFAIHSRLFLLLFM